MYGKDGHISGRKLIGITVCAMLVLSGFMLLNSERSSAALLTWGEATFDDFADSSFIHNVVVNGAPGGNGNITLEKTLGWYDMDPPVNPGKRTLFGFAFDAKNNVAVLFGGRVSGEGKKNDTWEYDYETNNWTKIISDGAPGNPSRRDYTYMDYDTQEEVIVLYGGVDDSSMPLTDIWEYDVNTKTWAAVSVGSRPPAMGGFSMAYDSVNHKMLVTGTPSGSNNLELWAYDAGSNSWDQRMSAVSLGRAGHAMAFSGSYMVVQGGAGGTMGEIEYDDTLVYDYGSNSWTEYNYEGDGTTPRPGFRAGNAMARYFNGVYDSGGNNKFQYLSDMWNFTYNGYGGWADETPIGDPKPPARDKHRMVFDSYHKVLILYGGYDADGRWNDTWVRTSGYASEGWYVSKWQGKYFYDSGSTFTTWKNIWWNKTPAASPDGTKLKFQIQTGTVDDPGAPDPGRTLFVGPFNSTTTYYDYPGQTITDEHKWHRYIRYQAYFEGIISQTPTLEDIQITYDTEGPPFIMSTDPADEETGVPYWKNITIEFSEPMNTGTVSWTFSDPSITWMPDQWSPDDKTLILKHTNPFEECKEYTVEVTAGQDLDGNDLEDPYDINPWTFTTLCVEPWIESTDPADEDTNVPLDYDIVIDFSEPMNNNTVTWTISPSSISLIEDWTNGNQTLNLRHGDPFLECRNYLVMVTGGEDLTGNELVDGPVPNPWQFTSFCDDPYVIGRDPEHGTTGVALNKDIIITFSEQMATGTVTWLVSTTSYDGPPINLSWSYVWSGGDTVLTISHSILFDQNTIYFVNVTHAEDLAGNQLNMFMGLSRWYFTTSAVGPFIVETDPHDGQTGVDVYAPIEITFSEAIVPVSFSFTCNPNPGGWSPSWSGGFTVVTLTHNPFMTTITYNCTVLSAEDNEGYPLEPGPVPNPWEFTTGLSAPSNLRVIKSEPNIIIQWDAVPGADQYNVYESQDRFASWPWTPLGSVMAPTTQITHWGAHDDGFNHFYIVRTYKNPDESGNSSMGAKVHRHISMAPPQGTDINWLSLPFNSDYSTASDIAIELTEENVRLIGKWDPSKQRAITYSFIRGKWRGSDFSINPGEGIFVGNIQTNFDWIIVGTDYEAILDFTYYPRHDENINWISIPYTGIYDSASDIVIDIEGSLLTSTFISEVGKWDPIAQAAITYYWSSGAWIGTDFTIEPGDGIYIIIKRDFNWPIVLLTPSV